MSLNVGMKIYSYCYGPMTVKNVDQKYVTASVDNSKGFSAEFAALCGNKDLSNIQFPVAAFGHWYFDKAADVAARKENNDFSEANQQSGSPRAMTRNDDYLHADFRTAKAKGGETYPVPVENKKGGETYPIPVEDKKDSETYPVEK